MKLFNIEILSNVNIPNGTKIYFNIVSDEMAVENSNLGDKYLLRFTTEDNKLFGFGLKTSLFAEYNSIDVINYIFEKNINTSNLYTAKVISRKVLSSKNKPLYTVELLNFNLEDKYSIKKNSPTSKRSKVNEFDYIIDYLRKNKIPEYLIESITKKHSKYPKKYTDLIPSFKDENFKIWDASNDKKNLLLMSIIQMEENLNMRFVGGKGSGKDTLLYTLGWIYQMPIFSFPTSRDTTTFDLLGDKTIGNKIVNDKNIQFIEFKKGPLVEAMEVGGIFEFGEGNTCSPEVSVALHSVLDHRRSIDVPGYKMVKADSNFKFIMTMNIGYIGCNDLNQAFIDRFSTLKFDSVDDISNILKQNCPEATAENINYCNKIYKSLLGIAKEFQDEDFITIRGYINALKMSKHIPLYNALECCLINSLSDDEYLSKRVKQIVDNIIAT